MKKLINWAYLLSGLVLGIIITTSGSAMAEQIKSLVGQKVTSELIVIVDGKELPNKAPVINGVTNAPVRAISDAIGADLKLEGKVINITTKESFETTQSATSDNTTENVVNQDNKYSRMTKEQLEEKKNTLEKQIENLNSGKQELLTLIESIKKKNGSTTDENVIKLGEDKIKEIQKEIETFSDPRLEECLAELEQVKVALDELK